MVLNAWTSKTIAFRMSRRRSTGDLVPKDITEILAREARLQRGHRKPGSSLGHAFSWLKGSKRKKSFGNSISRNATGVKDKVGVHVQDLSKGEITLFLFTKKTF